MTSGASHPFWCLSGLSAVCPHCRASLFWRLCVCTGVHTLCVSKVSAMRRSKNNFWCWSLLYTLFAMGSPCLSSAYALLVGLQPSENFSHLNFDLLQTCWDYRPVCHSLASTLGLVICTLVNCLCRKYFYSLSHLLSSHHRAVVFTKSR